MTYYRDTLERKFLVCPGEGGSAKIHIFKNRVTEKMIPELVIRHKFILEN